MRRFFYNIADQSISENVDNQEAEKLSTYQTGEQIKLTDSIYHHWCRVLRAKVGDSAYLFDGFGGSYAVTLTEITKKYAMVELGEFLESDNTPDMVTQVGLVMSRGDRMDYAIQKATEMGVTSIQLLTSEYGEMRLKASQVEKKLNHWQQVAIAACEQCCLNRVPLILAPKAINDWSQQASIPLVADEVSLCVQHLVSDDFYNVLNTSADLSLLLSVVQAGEVNATTSIMSVFADISLNKPFIRLLVGAEGGLSNVEEQTAIDNNWQSWQIGNRIMRTETAPVVALSNLQTVQLYF